PPFPQSAPLSGRPRTGVGRGEGAADPRGARRLRGAGGGPTMLPIPEFHDAARSASWTFRPDAAALAAAAHEWAGRHAIPPAAGARFRVERLLIDCQRDFCHPEGSLFVGGRSGNGAVEDVERVTRFVYRHLARISSITATLDTHVPLQIFSPGFWLDRAG